MLSELAVSGGPSVLIIDDLHELSSGYGENARAGVKAHFDTVTERGRAHHREIHRVLAAVDIEVSRPAHRPSGQRARRVPAVNCSRE